MIWHSSNIREVETELNTNLEDGLSSGEAEKRLKEYGLNLFESIKRKSFWKHLARQFKDYMVIILMIAALVSTGIAIYNKDSFWMESIAIVGIILINSIVSFIQEKRSEKALAVLKKVATPTARVIRDRDDITVNTSELVPGDIIYVEEGDTVPADARLISSTDLRCREYAVTGEILPMEKSAFSELKDSTHLQQRSNMIYAGTDVIAGSGKAVIVETGVNCEILKVLNQTKRRDEPLTSAQRSLAKMEKFLGIFALVCCLVYFAVGVFIMHQDLMTMVMTALALAVAIIPESLPAIVGVVLAVSLQRMAKQKAIVRRLDSLETLRNVTVICTDKTGALTSRDMKVKKAWAQTKTSLIDDEPLGDIAALLRIAALCCDAEAKGKEGKKRYTGNSMEIAILKAAEKMGYSKFTLENTLPRIGEIPFDHLRRLMSTVNIIAGRPVAIVKGAPDVLLPKCTHGSLKKARNVTEEMTQEGLSVIAIGYKYLEEPSAHPTPSEIENDLTLAGLIGIQDPAHQSALLAVKKCKAMGIKPVMLTGDHLNTAVSVAKELRILEREEEAVTGDQLRRMSDDELAEKIRHISVYARIQPEDKLRIVKMWKRKKEVVAMTGKRLTDVPALESAHIACALGQNGKDAVKNKSDLILADDSFSTVVSAIQYSRGIFENIRKAIRFLLGCNLGELLTVFTALVAGWGIPLIPIQLLWINLVTDSFPAIALAMEKPEPNLSRRPAPLRKESIFAGSLGLYSVLEGFMFGILTIGAYVLGRFYLEGATPQIGRSMAFAVLALSQIIHAHNVRSKNSIFKIGIFSNPGLWLASFVSIALVLVVMLTPARLLFDITTLTLEQWKWIALFAVLPSFVMEVAKLFRYGIKRKQERRRIQKEMQKRKEKAAE